MIFNTGSLGLAVRKRGEMNKGKTTGYYPYQLLNGMVRASYIRSDRTFKDSQYQPASIDLRLGEHGWRIRSSFLPDDDTVDRKLDALKMYPIDIRDGHILEKGSIYLIPLLEELDLPEDIRGETNPKSTTGRLDVFTRVVTDRSHRFDEIQPGYKGKMYLQIISRSFAVRVQTGLCLNQLRLRKGNLADCSVSDDEITNIHRETPLVYDDSGKPIGDDRLLVDNGLFISVAVPSYEDGQPVGYKAKKNSNILDLSRTYFYKTEDFWEPAIPDSRGFLILEPEEFYILVSKQKIRIPPEFVAEMVAYEPNSGELRTHYAGFFDPGFGFGKAGEVKGTKAILEVRPRDVPFMINDGQTFCKLLLKRMVYATDLVYGQDGRSHYQFQGLALSKHFKNGAKDKQLGENTSFPHLETLPLFENRLKRR